MLRLVDFNIAEKNKMKRNYPLTREKNRFWMIGLLITIMTISCGVLELRIEPAKQNRDLGAPDNQAPPLNPSSTQPAGQQTGQQSEQEARKGENGLNPTGPWLVFITGENLQRNQIWAANPDGSDMIVLADDALISGTRAPWLMPQISPNGRYIAYIELQESPLQAFLHIIELPSGSNKKIVMLYDETQIGFHQDILDTILYQASSLAWSPDGRTLAFIGALEGGTADLFIHIPDEQSVARLSDGPSQAYMPVWSADGKNILHTATSLFHRGEGYSPYMFTPDGLWTYQVDRGTIASIPWPFGSEPEYITYSPWHDSTFIFSGNGSPCEDSNGCWLDVVSGDKGSFPFPIIVYAISQDTGSLLATFFNTTMPSDDAGTYLFTPENPTGTRLFTEELENIQWLEKAGVFAGRVFTVPELRLLYISPSGEVVDTLEWGVPGEYMNLAASPDSSRTAWYRYVDAFETGLWLGLEGTGMLELRPIFDGAVHDAVWSPDSNWLFFVVDAYTGQQADTAQGLFVVDRDGQNPQHLFGIPVDNYLTVLGFAGN